MRGAPVTIMASRLLDRLLVMITTASPFCTGETVAIMKPGQSRPASPA
jgi:hypothetical protein